MLLIATSGASAASQTIVYVRPGATGAGDGTSWTDAFTDLQPALQSAAAPAQIWVAAGTYRPTTGTDREVTFQLRNGIELYGGFKGDEISLDQRDWVPNVTTLSGEIGGTEMNDNTCHIATAIDVDSTAVVDGFVISRGNAQACTWGGGGGMLIERAFPTVRNCELIGNNRTAVYNHLGSRPRLSDCVFGQNSGIRGAGMFNRDSSPVLQRVTFRENAVSSGGGGMANFNGSRPVCVDCVFEGNVSQFPGGAVYNTQSAPLFLRTTFVGNTSPNGGGAMYNDEEGGDMVCIGCLFRNNSTANGTGGAAMIRLLSRPAFINTVFEGNMADDFGGAVISDTGSELLFVNVVFAGNQARTGGAATFHTGSRRLVNVTFAGNRAQTGGGALEIGFGETEVLNSVLWDNGLFDGRPGEIHHTGGFLAMRHSLVSGGCNPPFTCEAVIDADPLFVRPPVWNGTTLVDAGDLRLQEGSPGVDAGLAAYLPADIWDLDADGDTTEVLPLDILGQPRVQGAEVDLGAYEGGVVVAGEPAAPGDGLVLTVSPNPVRGAGVVILTLPPDRGRGARGAAVDVRVSVYDVLGRETARLHAGPLAAGTYTLSLDVASLSAGVYSVRAAGHTEAFTVIR